MSATLTDTSHIILRQIKERDYQFVWQKMRDFTDNRGEHTPDEIWFVEHDPVFTQGQNGKPEHLLNPHDIPVVQTDRGGQITYHGPGQLVAYIMVDLRRKGLKVRPLVSAIENAIIDFLAEYDISAAARCDAPGVYVAQEKICSLGLRIRRGYSYHGLAFNIDMDLTPFSQINPCGFKDLSMTQLKDFGVQCSLQQVAEKLTPHLCRHLGYDDESITLELS